MPRNTLTEKQAVARVAEYWNSTHTDPGDEFAPTQAKLTDEEDFWIISGNTKALVVDRDETRRLVGYGGFLVNAMTGDLHVVGSAQKVEDILQDLRDDRAAEGRFYVLAAGTGSGDHSEVSALRKVVPCGIMHARQLLTSPIRFWFTGKKRLLQGYVNQLHQLGLPSEIILVDDPSSALPVAWTSSFRWDFERLVEQIKAVQG